MTHLLPQPLFSSPLLHPAALLALLLLHCPPLKSAVAPLLHSNSRVSPLRIDTGRAPPPCPTASGRAAHIWRARGPHNEEGSGRWEVRSGRGTVMDGARSPTVLGWAALLRAQAQDKAASCGRAEAGHGHAVASHRRTGGEP